jgi:hypothetical protein
VRLVLSHIPIEKTILTNIQAEGKFTTEGGGKYINILIIIKHFSLREVFLDRI